MSFVKYSDGSVKTMSLDMSAEEAAKTIGDVKKNANNDVKRVEVDESNDKKKPSWANK